MGALIVAGRNLVGSRHVIYGAMLLHSAVQQVPAAFPVVCVVGMASNLYTTATTVIVQVEYVGGRDKRAVLLSCLRGVVLMSVTGHLRAARPRA